MIFDISCPVQYRTEINFNAEFYEDQKGQRKIYIKKISDNTSNSATIDFEPMEEEAGNDADSYMSSENMSDVHEEELTWDSEEGVRDFPIIYVKQLSETSLSGFSNKTDDKIMAAVVELMADLDLSSAKAVKAVQIVGNRVFGQCFTLPNEMKSDTDQNLKKFDLIIDPFQLPCRKSSDEHFKLYALNSEKEVGKSILNNDSNILMCDGTTKQKVGKIITLPVQSNDEILLLPFHKVSNETQGNLVSLLCYQLKRLEILTGADKELLWTQIVATMTDLASENHGLAKAVSEQLNIEHIPGQLFCVAHSTLGYAEGCKKIMQAIESKIGYDKIFGSFSSENAAHRCDKNYSAVWDCKYLDKRIV
jgi:hypothetical protein